MSATGGGTTPTTVLAVDGLRVHFHTDVGVVKAVDGVSWSVGRGETLGIVGESGSGKSVSALAVMGLVPRTAGGSVSGAIHFDGRNLLAASEDELREIRGNGISMVFQDPRTSLNPVLKVGHQIADVVRAHENVGRVVARRRAVELLGEVGIPDPRQRAQEYPHQFSGGMRQRAVIAMALALDPMVLLADEPTAALDVTIQAQIMELLGALQERRGTAIVLITHDMGLIAGHADRVAVLYAGRVAEAGTVEDVFYRPRHPYTAGLVSSLARLDRRRGDRARPMHGQPPAPVHDDDVAAATDVRPRPGDRVATEGGPLLEVVDLVKHYPVRSGLVFKQRIGSVRAVDGISFTVDRGETFALVGESGCGKSTAARAVLRLIEPTSGTVRLDGTDVTRSGPGRLRALRRQMQLVFQDPYASLNPRMTVHATLLEPFRIHGLGEDADVEELLELVGLSPEHAARRPGQLSGGERQRVGIARALALHPKLLVCDEPVSALDVSIRAQVLNLLEDLQDRLALTYLFIAHDLGVVRHVADRIAVMYLGSIVEVAESDDLFERASHPYSQALISSVPVPDPLAERRRRRIVVSGEVPTPVGHPNGCRFHTRCPKFANELSEAERRLCVEETPALVDRDGTHPSACHYAEARQLI